MDDVAADGERRTESEDDGDVPVAAADAGPPSEDVPPARAMDLGTGAGAAAAGTPPGRDDRDPPVDAAYGKEADGDMADDEEVAADDVGGVEEEEEEEEEEHDTDLEADGDDGGGPELPPEVVHLRFRNYKPRDPLLQKLIAPPHTDIPAMLAALASTQDAALAAADAAFRRLAAPDGPPLAPAKGGAELAAAVAPRLAALDAATETALAALAASGEWTEGG
ncbi:hypothetical protein MMPV_004578 [Pyropia vietnamensis]